MSRNGLVQSRLDYWLISTHLLYDLHSQDISPGLKSDHSIVKFNLKVKNSQQKGRGFFKFNSTLLKDPLYVDEIKNIIKDSKNNPTQEQNLGLMWDTLKCQIIRQRERNKKSMNETLKTESIILKNL